MYIGLRTSDTLHKKPYRIGSGLCRTSENRTTLQRQSKALSRKRSWTRLPAVSSNIAGTVYRFDCYDGRCRKLVCKLQLLSSSRAPLKLDFFQVDPAPSYARRR
jgi:hypothetical protein